MTYVVCCVAHESCGEHEEEHENCCGEEDCLEVGVE